MKKGIVVGAGRAGEVLNLQPLQEAGAEIVAVCDLFVEQAKKVAERNNIEHSFKTLKQAAKKVKADFAVICTPQQAHYSNCKEALELGLHVLVEKPYTETLAQAKKLEELAKKKKKKIVVVHNFKFLPGLQEAKAIFDSGKIGKPLLITRTWIVSGVTDRMIKNKDLWAHKLAGGKWNEALPHALYTPMMFVDPKDIEFVNIDTQKPDKRWPWLSADQVIVTLRAKDTYIVIFFSAKVNPKTERLNDMAIYGTKGVIFANYSSARLVEGVSEVGKLKYSANKTAHFGKKIVKGKFSKEPRGASTGHYFLSEQFLAYLSNRGKIPVSQSEAYHTMRLTEKVANEIDKNRKKK